MAQKFKIPIYLILSRYTYDESNQYTMLCYSFDKDEAMKMLKGRAMKFAKDFQMEATIPEWCTDESVWEVGNQIFELEEREINV